MASFIDRMSRSVVAERSQICECSFGIDECMRIAPVAAPLACDGARLIRVQSSAAGTRRLNVVDGSIHVPNRNRHRGADDLACVINSHRLAVADDVREQMLLPVIPVEGEPVVSTG